MAAFQIYLKNHFPIYLGKWFFEYFKIKMHTTTKSTPTVVLSISDLKA